MVQFRALRLQGFKSFVEPTTLDIAPGMTGIVGPNGCGKSNLVEALRWAMGETSAKKMRGGEMDDVIFGGTEQRPARNVAEVTLVLDNQGRDATAEFNSADELEVSRKIERGEGSDYRVNGKAVRQKDVQLLFADQATGAHSTSIVSQGQVGAIVNAKPQERRQILEEAAGITGLHARRHEAELRLKAAEANLTRVADIVSNMTSQMNALARQAKQASKYRTLSENIRKTEAALLHVKWQAVTEDLAAEEAHYANSERLVRDLTVSVASGNTVRAEMATALPPLRQEEASKAAALQRLIIARENIDQDLARLATQLAAAERTLAQTIDDDAREQTLAADATAALEKLSAEGASIEAQQSAAAAGLPAAESAVANAASAVDTQQATVTDLTKKLASVTAARQSLSQQITALQQRCATLQERQATATAERAALVVDAAQLAELSDAKAAVASAEAVLEARQSAVTESEAAQSTAEAQLNAAREAKSAAAATLNKFEAEASALIQLLAGGDDLFAPLVDQVSAEAGFEVALAAALGDALSAPLDSAAQIYWQTLPAYGNAPNLPQGAEPISAYIKAPAALGRALAQIGLVADAAAGNKLAADLQPGQVLVSRQGDAWRWDGYTIKADAPTAAAIKLKQKNRLVEVKAEIATCQQTLQQKESELTTAQQTYDAALAATRAARDGLQHAYAALSAARAEESRLTQLHAATTSRALALETQLQNLAEDLAKAQADQTAAEQQLAATEQPDLIEQSLAVASRTLADLRQQQTNHQQSLSNLTAELAGYARRLQTITTEQASWQQRAASASQRRHDLQLRIEAARTEIQLLQARPAGVEAEKRALFTQISAAETARQQATDALVLAEEKLAAHERELKKQETTLTEARENRVRAEAAVQAAQHLQTELLARMQEKLDCTPDMLLAIAGDELAAALPAPQQLEQELNKFMRERDALGPVNLRADVEATDLQTELDKVTHERDELTAAIAKLRQGISDLNTEARERLQTAFTQVNDHFQDLFVRLFGGGRAYLELIENEDALDAGLEIYASPPGKKLQVLSLLSGGEKALTATALLFAVFLCNPSPICVLDEVDAPLDESNVGRFCDLVEELARRNQTRFLIITHHRLTMARMDRLYGVTMQERGVSTLMSVDLATAERFRESKAAA